MTHKPFKVLFLCTGNSARSIIAEALLNSGSRNRFVAYSAGCHPTRSGKSASHTGAHAAAHSHGWSASKGWEEFATPGGSEMDFVITVCDNAAGEVCPVWPGQPITAHWGMADPAAVEVTQEAKINAFRDVAVMMKRRIDIMQSLPLESLDRLATQKQVRDVANQ